MPRIPINEQKNNRCGVGREKGSLNYVTKALKETMALIVKNELEKVPAVLDSVRDKHPDKYVQLIIRMAEIVLPKTQQVELANTEGIDIHATLEDMRDKLLKNNE